MKHLLDVFSFTNFSKQPIQSAFPFARLDAMIPIRMQVLIRVKTHAKRERLLPLFFAVAEEARDV